MTVAERLSVEALAAMKLESGAHEEREDGVCVMEAVAWMAGEPHSDAPSCTSPVLAAFLRRWNDDLDDGGRQRLKPYIPRVIGTAGDRAADERRGWMLTDWMVRTYTPAWLQLAGLTAQADSLRSLPALASPDTLALASGPLEAASSSAAASWAASWAASRAASWAAAAPHADAYAAAYEAAFKAATEFLRPTVASLQESALELLDRMLAVRS